MSLQLYRKSKGEEAQQLQEIDLKIDQKDAFGDCQRSETDHNSYSEGQEEHVVSNRFLKVMEVVGFWSSDDDVKFVLDIIRNATCFETLICDPRYFEFIGTPLDDNDDDDAERTDTVKSRAHKLAKLLPSNVHIFVRDTSGLFRISL
ncbi:hypothetical protein RND81_12G137800 [Saponaria officinalis]|uniref:FBD domain-containing protein n=1 Tax=Saponaria officinalis TaxID=3572 RepID=A0AAW1HAA8_SAPOF